MKLLTFNAGLLDFKFLGRTFFKPINHIRYRLAGIPERLIEANADIICLQEVYHAAHKNFFIKQLQSVYPYYYYAPLHFVFGFDSGLMIFSKLPLETTHYKRYSSQPFEESLFSKKAVLGITVLWHDLRIGVINSHATSSGLTFRQDERRIERIRKSQIEDVIQLAHMIKESEKCNLVFVTGDYNCGPQISEKNYKLFEEFGLLDLYNKENEEYTWDPDENILLQQSQVYKNTPKQRVDLILATENLTNHFSDIDVSILFKENCVEVNDGSIVPISDHYGVMATIK